MHLSPTLAWLVDAAADSTGADRLLADLGAHLVADGVPLAAGSLTLMAFGLLFCAMTFVWLCAYSVAVARAGDALRRPRIRRTLDAVMGAALVALGVRVAAER